MRKSRGPPSSDVFRVSDFSLILLKTLSSIPFVLSPVEAFLGFISRIEVLG